ncbi:flagellar biosynthesis protein FlhA [Burkholderia ubonensis]|uniref:flagellar biosynthesis protein FlhA n=1 Tax=Burkholderia ubonensis TaxID=101571 RepID=UPI0007530721|nr:flagellar biosynthesis protein FlhA [Burkholderia ubonensis]KVW73114.1 type III secretion protein [Burkholderia ubonensis]
MSNNTFRRRLQASFSRHSDTIPVIAILGVLCLIVFPLPVALLDVALALNLTLSVLVLALSIYVPHALYLSTFPTLLLVSTLFRLGLNIASTRQILLNGYAGEIITTFGQLVVGGNVIVGFVVFIIIAIIQFVVVAKGADRVAEVGARFSLDALPGKQMAIDADLRAGLISKSDAVDRRRQLEQTSQFYGAMDGASKFVKGDAIAGLLIALVNVVGGIVIGTAVNGHPLADTARLYTVLTVGDGLVSQIPSLLISFAAGILITRVASPDSRTAVGTDIGAQITAQPKAVFAAGVVALGFAVVPGFPTLAFLGLAAALIVLAAILQKLGGSSRARQAVSHAWARRDGATHSVGDLGLSPPLRVRVAPDLLSRLSTNELNRLLLRFKARFRESGVPYPGLRLATDESLPTGGYAVDIDEVPLSTGQFALGASEQEPDSAKAATISSLGERFRKTDLEEQLVAQIETTVMRQPWRFLGIQEASYLQDELAREYPQLVNLLAERVHLFAFRAVLIELLKAGIHIRNLRAIGEGLANASAHPNDIDGLTSSCRQALASQISYMWVDDGRRVPIVVLAPNIEATLRRKLVSTESCRFIDLGAHEQQQLGEHLVKNMNLIGKQIPGAVIITGQDLRRSLEGLIRQAGGKAISVLAVEELSDDVGYQIIHTVEIPGWDTHTDFSLA